MKIVVTGATGFIGRPLCFELASLGHTLTALSRDPARAQSALGPSVDCVAWCSGKAVGNRWQRAISEADAVVHLAGHSVAESAWTPQVKQQLRASRIDTTRMLVEAMRAPDSRPKTFVCASGINYYGDRGDELLTEESPPGNTFLSQLCVEWENEARKAEDRGIRVVMLRSGIVLERGGPLEKVLYPLPVPVSPWFAGLGGPIGSGRQWFPWVHRNDAVGMIAWSLADSRVSGPVNTVAPGLIRNVEFTRALGRALHRPAILPIPKFALRALVGGFADELVTSQRAEPAVANRLGYAYRYPQIGQALESIFARQTADRPRT